MTPAVLLWDFGDTLVDERWMRRPPAEFPTWEAVWLDVMGDHADDWNVGQVGSTEMFGALAERSGMSAAAVKSHARGCCERLLFNETAWRVASERRLPQALVTVNPDLFADFVVPAHGLDDVFDVIVMSFEELTDDKPALCEIALDRLGFTGPRSDALLIDNRRDLVEAWRDVGGSGYWFQSDQQLRADLPSLLLPGAS
jgi:phosphoglycolate phosphatase-like HAD superfamily hydrolase